MMMLSVAASIGLAHGAEAIAIAAHAGDHAIYPDCREEFFRRMDDVLSVTDYNPIRVSRPFANMSKADIIRGAYDSNFISPEFAPPLYLTWSCYEGGANPKNLHCGKCGTCVERKESKQVDGPRNMPNEGLLLGFNVFRGVKKPVRIGLTDRQRHMYVVGQTGTGKSTFLENLALQDMLRGDGFAFVDPHGDTAEKLLAMVPKERTEDVIYFCPSDMTYPMGLNLFEFHTPDQKDFIIQEVLNMLYKLYDPQHQGIMGPRYESLFRNAALTVMADPAGSTFVDIPKLFRDPQYVKQKLPFVKDPNVIEFWEKEMPQSQRSNEFGEVVSWFVSKFGAFLSNEMMRNIIGQTKSSFDLRDIMDNKKILLVNLSKGRTGELNSKLLGMVFVMKFQAAAMSRSNVPESERNDFALYVDEFQNFSTDSFATIMSEARKYHLNLIVANQFTTQLTEEIRDAV
jgi:hypothetical protein